MTDWLHNCYKGFEVEPFVDVTEKFYILIVLKVLYIISQL